ncbi:MAG: hypothetical protein ACFB02_08215 [Mastigocoleus sp.]
MIDIQYGDFVIKLKEIPKYSDWIVVIRNENNKTIASEDKATQKEALEWGKNYIDRIAAAGL